MAIKQFLALCEQTVRNTFPGSPSYKFYPVTGKLDPDVEYKEEAANEFRGQDTSQGDVTDDRTSTAWKYTLEGRVYPGPELAMFLTYLFGSASAPAVVDTSAERIIFKTVTEMFGDGASLADKAIAIIPNTAKGSSTYSQRFLGGRIKDGEFEFKGGENVAMKLGFMGGPWVGLPEQPETSGMAFPGAQHFRAGHLKVFIGTGAVLTGSAPDYTDIAEGTMAQAKPDDWSIKIEPGIDDQYKMNGEVGPSVTERTGKVKVSGKFTIDFSDPASGFSAYDLWSGYFAEPQYAPLMLKLDNGQVCGSTTQTYQLYLYLPKVKIKPSTPERKSDGSKQKISFDFESRVDAAVNVACYAKLIH